MPSIPADPLDGTFTVTYSNGGSSKASLVVLEVDVQFQGPTSSLDWVFFAMPEAQVLDPGAMATVQLTKDPGTGMPGKGSGSVCDYCGAPATLTLYLERGGGVISFTSAPITIACLQ
jgi:hypothetical protein